MRIQLKNKQTAVGAFSLNTRYNNYIIISEEWCVCVCMCGVIPFILGVRLVDVPVGVSQKEGHTGFLIHLPFGMLVLIFSREKDSAVPFPRRP